MTEHTPGPWKRSIVNRNFSPKIYGPDDWMVADCSRIVKRSMEEETANARLIAAAPELLEALEAFANVGPEGRGFYGWHEAYNPAIAKARAAIAKAKGGE